jgi:sugar phosphate isomerase/epimerase
VSADGPSQLPVVLAFAGLAGAGAVGSAPTVLPTEAGEALRAFFEAHPAVEFVQFELALDEAGEDLEFAAGTLHGADGAPLREDRETRRAAEAFRRLLRTDAALAALPVRLVVAMEGLEHTFRIPRDATGAARPAGESADADERAARRERARLEAQDARWDQRDLVRDDDHVA